MIRYTELVEGFKNAAQAFGDVISDMPHDFKYRNGMKADGTPRQNLAMDLFHVAVFAALPLAAAGVETVGKNAIDKMTETRSPVNANPSNTLNLK